MDIYKRNRIYINEPDQAKLRNYKVLIAGSGIGSVIAECALRLGFENITVVDGDKVELTNLNRQNYIYKDIGKTKAESIAMRLRSINPNANIKVYDQFITSENITSFIEQYDVAINALDFTSDVPFKFDEACQSKNIPVLHPYNIGWAGLVFVVMPNGKNLGYLSNDYHQFEKEVIHYVLENIDKVPKTKEWLEHVLSEYLKEKEIQSPPQLSISSFLLAGGCTHLLYKLALNKPVKAFPEFYIFGLEDSF
ncbi:ThiF family adenylyltransferase [Arachidicoccus soli]|uniref:ThiF family adenylyltransferase n=1 Tax=Arachidicoccus soli TaxID=2341117 RepID=A0A386HUL9_9BACT|nr:ThiF family adenylyltransferase [Arachidicoccus soli]AYD49064.1 ThiF family adenylyltransferase [Arachidicoccus soli]